MYRRRKCPPLAHDVVDAEAMKVLEQWIMNMDDRGRLSAKQ